MSLRGLLSNRLSRLPPQVSSSSEENVRVATAASSTPPRRRKSSPLPTLFVLVFAFTGGLFHYCHVARVYTNHLSFHLLTNTERELSYYSESGFYYSFFKQLIIADNYWHTLASFLNDTVTEYPQQFGCLEVDEMGRKHGHLPSFAQCSSPRAPLSVPPINDLQHFNIYPEVFAAGLYRVLRHFKLLHSDCFRVSLGENISTTAYAATPEELVANNGSNGKVPILESISAHSGDTVISCDGPLEPPIFYATGVFLLAGLTVVALALSGWQVASCGSLSNATSPSHSLVSLWGAILPVFGFFANHDEATRVQWAPQLRESAYPIFLLQQTCLLWLLKTTFNRRTRFLAVKYAAFVLLLLTFMLSWQFAQFVLLTQLAALMLTFGVLMLSRGSQLTFMLFSILARRLQDLFVCFLAALLFSFGLEFGNPLLLTSGYFPLLLGCITGIILHRRAADKIPKGTLVIWQDTISGLLAHLSWIGFAVLSITIAVGLAIRLIDPGDGGHIIDLLKVKLVSAARYRTFHTQMYTCSSEFDFPGWGMVLNLSRTGSLPLAGLAVLITVAKVLFSSTVATPPSKQLENSKSDISSSSSSSLPYFPSSSASSISSRLLIKETARLISDFLSLFVVFQLLAFAILAGLFMRLKLLFVPQLCLTLALLAQPQLFFGSQKLLLLATRMFLPAGSSSKSTTRTAPSSYSSFNSSASKISWTKTIFIHSLFILMVSFKLIRSLPLLQSQWYKVGQFSAYTCESMLMWARQLPARAEGDPPWVFSGAMPEMAKLRVGLIDSSLPFAITNHPHYENQLIRERTELAYAVTSRKPVKSVWQIYRHVLKADFVVIPSAWCSQTGQTHRPLCSSAEIWDLLDPQFDDSPAHPVCRLALQPSNWDDWSNSELWPYFSLVFRARDASLVVLRVNPVEL